MEFVFTALDPQGSRIQERLQAVSEDEAVQNLHNRGFVVLALTHNARAEKKSQALGGGSRRSRKVKPEQVVALTREFAIMIETGVSLVEAMDLLIDHNVDGPIRQALIDTPNSVSMGASMTDAMSAHPMVFPKLYLDMVRAAELGGSLDETLNRAADYQEYALEMRRKVKSALTYPSVLVCFAGLVIIFMMSFLIPQFHSIYEQMHVEMPPTTRFLFAESMAMRAHWWLAPILLIVGIPLSKRLFRTSLFRVTAARLMRRLPLVGDTVVKVSMARLLRALEALMSTGVSLLAALDAAAQTTQDMLIEQAFKQVCTQVEQGRSLAAALLDSGVVPGLVCQMVAVGEKSGKLPQVLQRVARYYEQEVDARLKGLTSMIEPLMVVVIGVVVGFVAVSVITPIYSVLDTIK